MPESVFGGYECPRCKSKAKLCVEAKTWVELSPAGLRLESDYVPFTGPFYDAVSEMHCGACGYDGKVIEFAKEGVGNEPAQLEFDLLPRGSD